MFFFSIVGKSQETSIYNNYEVKILKESKKTFIKKNIVITNEEAEYFWPLYEKYNEKSEELNDKYLALLEEYSEKKDAITFSEAMDIWEEIMDLKNNSLKLEREYYKKMINKISPVKIVAFFNLERKLRSKVIMVLAKDNPDLILASN
jgi:hypothetical protein